jgi:hypothetical protein
MSAPQPPSSSVQRASRGQARWRGSGDGAPWATDITASVATAAVATMAQRVRSPSARTTCCWGKGRAHQRLSLLGQTLAGPFPAHRPSRPRIWLSPAPRPYPGVQTCRAGSKAPCDLHQRHRAGHAPTGPGASAPAARRCTGTPRPPRNDAQQGSSSGDACALPRGERQGVAHLGLSSPPRRPARPKPRFSIALLRPPGAGPSAARIGAGHSSCPPPLGTPLGARGHRGVELTAPGT